MTPRLSRAPLVAALSALLALAGAQAMAFGPIMVTEPGADGFNIETMAFNGSSYDITQLTFDFTGTTTTDPAATGTTGTGTSGTSGTTGSTDSTGTGTTGR